VTAEILMLGALIGFVAVIMATFFQIPALVLSAKA
jgi:hypothetical protein